MSNNAPLKRVEGQVHFSVLMTILYGHDNEGFDFRGGVQGDLPGADGRSGEEPRRDRNHQARQAGGQARAGRAAAAPLRFDGRIGPRRRRHRRSDRRGLGGGRSNVIRRFSSTPTSGSGSSKGRRASPARPAPPSSGPRKTAGPWFPPSPSGKSR